MKKSKQSKYHDIWAALLFTLVGIIVWIDALRLLPTTTSRLSGPDIWLKIVGTLLIFMSVLLLAAEFFKKKAKQTETEDSQTPLAKEIIIAMFITGFYVFFLLKYVGFLVSSIIYLTIMPILLTGKNASFKTYFYYLSFSTFLSVFFWYAFYKVLNVQLPAGTIWKIIA